MLWHKRNTRPRQISLIHFIVKHLFVILKLGVSSQRVLGGDLLLSSVHACVGRLLRSVELQYLCHYYPCYLIWCDSYNILM